MSSQITFYPGGTGDLTGIPNATGFGTHWQCVATNDGSTSFVSCNSGGYYTDLYTYIAQLIGGVINFVRVGAISHAPTTDTYTSIKNVIKPPGAPSEYYGPANSATHLVDRYNDWYSNPYTGARWSWIELYETQFGVSISHGGPAYETGAGIVYMTVDYDPAGIKSTAGMFDGCAVF